MERIPIPPELKSFKYASDWIFFRLVLGTKACSGWTLLRFIRIILAVIVAWSVAVAPIAGGFAAAAPVASTLSPHALMHAGKDTKASDHVHHAGGYHIGEAMGSPGGCCADQDQGPAQKLPGDCSTMPGCVLKCFSVMPIATASLAVPVIEVAILVWQVSHAMPPEPPAPPFHPPRS